MKRWQLDWQFGHATVRSSAAMLWDCEFRLPSGRRFAPLARAPWAEDPTIDPKLPAHMRHLGGEFVCVPFGIGGRPAGLLPEWASASWDYMNPAPHGWSSDSEWTLVSADAGQVRLRLDYPKDDDISFLTRTISVAPDAPALDLELVIHARRATRQPVGLHPIVRLPEFPQQVKIDARFDFGLTYPADVPPGVGRVAIGQRFSTLSAIPGINGGTVDYSTLPKDAPTEEMLMLCKVAGPLTVRYPNEQAWLRLSWDTTQLPSCLLWPSDRALGDPPWNHCFRGIGIEPIAALFDSAREVALERNPLNTAGVATAIAIAPNEPLTIRYRLEAGEV